MQSEEMVPQPDGTEMPQLTVIVRGYKIIFRAKVAHHEDTRPQYGLFVSCSSLKSVKTENDELNFRVSQNNCAPLAFDSLKLTYELSLCSSLESW